MNRDWVFIGDVHLDRGDACLDAFVAFLDSLAARTARVVLMGDLFNLWIGTEEFRQEHHRTVLGALARLRKQDVEVHYIEGNRDYRIGPDHAGREFSSVSTDGISLRCGDRRIWAVHGDLANVDDRQYRSWRRFSRSAVPWNLLRLVPRSRRLGLVESMETRMRSSNLRFKSEFPEERVRHYAAQFLRAGHDLVVLGHFHLERDLPIDTLGRVLVLPEWKGSRRHLRIDPDGAVEFVDSGF